MSTWNFLFVIVLGAKNFEMAPGFFFANFFVPLADSVQ